MPRYSANGTKYQVGYEFPNHKRLTKHMGSHPKWKTSIWMWECVNCKSEHGPSMINSITRLEKVPSCCYTKTGDLNPKWRGYKGISGTYISQCRKGAAKRGYEFSVTPEQMWAQWVSQDGKCRYSGRNLTHGIDASLDRIDNLQGYILGNIQWVHKNINSMKSDMAEETFLELCREVTTYERNCIKL